MANIEKVKFLSTVRNVQKTLFWFNPSMDSELKKFIEKRNGFRFLEKDSLNQAIEFLYKFDINLLWSKAFWGLNQNESICILASEPYSFLKRLRDGKIEIPKELCDTKMTQ